MIFSKMIQSLLKTISYLEDTIIINRKDKSAQAMHLSSRRSQYIGVFKNQNNWQALISINKRKTYIDTYSTEIEAAKAYDFYSILLNKLLAKTNFDYSKSEIISMVENYYANGRKFIP